VVNDLQVQAIYNTTMRTELSEYKVDTVLLVNRSMRVAWAPNPAMVSAVGARRMSSAG
jgi:hypothetical protein